MGHLTSDRCVVCRGLSRGKYSVPVQYDVPGLGLDVERGWRDSWGQGLGVGQSELEKVQVQIA